MPIYEYRCDKCKNEFEQVSFKMNDETPVACPKCKSKKTKKLMSSFGRGRYSSLLSGGSAPAPSSGGGCSSCSSSNCSSCGH